MREGTARERRRGRRAAAAVLPAVLALLAAAATASAAQAAPAARAARPLAVTGAWARTTPDGATTGAAYLTIRGGAAADTLTGVRVAASVARAAELHESMLDGAGMMDMGAVAAVPVPAGGSVTFKPGGLHVMLVGLARPLRTGQTLRLTLVFARAGKLTVGAAVRPR